MPGHLARVIRFPSYRRARRSLSVLGGYGQVNELEHAHTRLVWISTLASLFVLAALQLISQV
jgi:hypothetical protein